MREHWDNVAHEKTFVGRVRKRVVFGNLEGAVRRGRDGKEKEWTDCVQSDIRAFAITGDWKATALKGYCCCCFSHSGFWLPTPKKLLYTVANPARGLLNREKKKSKKKSGSAPPPSTLLVRRKSNKNHVTHLHA